VVPLGGGGLVSGIALAACERKANVRVDAVGASFVHPNGYTIADGIRVKTPGDKPRALMERYVTDIVRVGEDSIVRAVQQIALNDHLLVEGAGAVGLAALLMDRVSVRPESRVVVVLSGGNMDMARLAALLQDLA